MSAGLHNITIEKGINYDLTLTLKDSSGTVINITNYTFKSEIRRKAETGLIKAFTITKTNATGGVINLEMTGANTASLPTGKLQWDLVAKDDGNKVRRYVYGDVTVIEPISDTSFA